MRPTLSKQLLTVIIKNFDYMLYILMGYNTIQNDVIYTVPTNDQQPMSSSELLLIDRCQNISTSGYNDTINYDTDYQTRQLLVVIWIFWRSKIVLIYSLVPLSILPVLNLRNHYWKPVFRVTYTYCFYFHV